MDDGAAGGGAGAAARADEERGVGVGGDARVVGGADERAGELDGDGFPPIVATEAWPTAMFVGFFLVARYT